jgi:hypothetical protein
VGDGGFCDACFTGDYPTSVPSPTSTPVTFVKVGMEADELGAYQAAFPGV